jgi:microcompartment protein CcmL/EutN
MQEKTISPQRGNTMSMEVIPEAREMLAYLLNHEDQMSEWEQNFTSNMTYWLKVRKKEPDQIQLMMLSVIYNRLKNPA